MRLELEYQLSLSKSKKQFSIQFIFFSFLGYLLFKISAEIGIVGVINKKIKYSKKNKFITVKIIIKNIFHFLFELEYLIFIY